MNAGHPAALAGPNARSAEGQHNEKADAASVMIKPICLIVAAAASPAAAVMACR